MEEWKQIIDYPEYFVSNFGNVKRKERLKKPVKDRTGYLNCQLFNKEGAKIFKIHRLVGGAFIANPENNPNIDHIDFDKTNNNFSNLRWVNRIESQQHRKKTDIKKSSKYKNVSFNKRDKRWRVQIKINKKVIFLGQYKTELEGAIAYNNYIIEKGLQEFFVLNDTSSND
jgi:hypothetical protein